jgi:hypothetical protein
MRAISRWLYTLLPYIVRVYANSAKAWALYYLLGLRGFTAPINSADKHYSKYGRPMFGYGVLSARVTHKGRVNQFDLSGDDIIEYRDLGANTVTDAGVAFFADDWFDGSKDISNFKNHAMGVGGSPPSAPGAGATALVTEVESRQAGSMSKPAANQVRSIATITATAPRVINEWGLFSQLALGGTMFASRWFAAINLALGDSIEFTYTFTFTSFTS